MPHSWVDNEFLQAWVLQHCWNSRSTYRQCVGWKIYQACLDPLPDGTLIWSDLQSQRFIPAEKHWRRGGTVFAESSVTFHWAEYQAWCWRLKWWAKTDHLHSCETSHLARGDWGVGQSQFPTISMFCDPVGISAGRRRETFWKTYISKNKQTTYISDHSYFSTQLIQSVIYCVPTAWNQPPDSCLPGAYTSGKNGFINWHSYTMSHILGLLLMCFKY